MSVRNNQFLIILLDLEMLIKVKFDN
jgi:hypothetical protein